MNRSIFITFLQLLLIFIVPPTTQKCISVISPNFSECAGDGNTTEPPEDLKTPKNCHDIHVCRKGFNVSYVNLEPISHEVYRKLVISIIRHCCGPCTTINIVNFYKDMTQINQSSINSSDIVFPILGDSSMKRLYGYHFITLLDIQGSYYITTKLSTSVVLTRLAFSCLNLWPLLITMILTSLIAGFIMWVIDTWHNKKEFSRIFAVGLFEGFWWSFISMTTVGYGDKVPRFVVARLFSVLWIVIGITMISMFTASLSTEVTSAVTPKIPDMHGKTVGVIKQRLNDIALVAEHGGIIKESKGVDLPTDVMELIINLQMNKIDGFILEKLAYAQILKYFKLHNITHEHGNFFENNTLKTEKVFRSIKLSYGILVKHEDDYEHLHEFVQDNRLALHTCIRFGLNVGTKDFTDIQHDIFSPDGGMFIPFLIATFSVIGFILCFGIIYELVRWKITGRRQKSPVTEVHEMNNHAE